MVLKSVIDRPEETYCITDHIHFAATSTFVAFSLEKGRTYSCPDTCMPSDEYINTRLLDKTRQLQSDPMPVCVSVENAASQNHQQATLWMWMRVVLVMQSRLSICR